MPRLIHAVPKYQKHRASGQAVVTINGRDYYLGPHGTKASKLEYDRLVTEWLSSGRSSSFGAPENAITVVELIRDYLRHAKSYYGTSPTSEYHRLIRVLRPLKDLYGRSSVLDLGPLQFKAVRQCFVDRDLSRTYVNETMRRLIGAFKWAAAEGKIPASIPQNLAIVPGLRKGKCALHDPDPILPVEDSVVDATLPHLPEVVADMVRLQRLTGARPAEVCIVRPCDLDRSGDVWLYRPSHHKTEHHDKHRVVPIGPKGQEILLRYLARGPQDFCFRPTDSEAKRRAAQHAARKTPLSCGNKPGTNRKRKPKRSAGDCYTTCSYRRAIHRGCDKAFCHPTLGDAIVSKLPDEKKAELKKWQSDHRWAPNQLRHAAATEVRREFGLEAAQVILGHSQANVTQVYAERDLAKGIEVAKKIG
jgi:integrase